MFFFLRFGTPQLTVIQWGNLGRRLPKQLMGCLTVLPNDEKMLMTDLSLNSGKKFRPRKNPKMFLDSKNCFGKKKVTNIQKVTHPYLARLLKKLLEVFTKIMQI